MLFQPIPETAEVHSLSGIHIVSPAPHYAAIRFAPGKGPKDINLSPANASITVRMPCCGQSFRYATIYNIPTETTPCPCGADWAWVVRYEE